MARFVKNNLGLFLVVGLVLIVGFCLFKYFPVSAQEQIKILNKEGIKLL